MGVFGSSDSDSSRKLEADIAFIKSRLDLIARHLSESGHTDPSLDEKLHAIYRAITTQARPADPPAVQAPPVPDDQSLEALSALREDVTRLLSESDRSMELDLSHRMSLSKRLDALERQISTQTQTVAALKEALRELISSLRNR